MALMLRVIQDNYMYVCICVYVCVHARGQALECKHEMCARHILESRADPRSRDKEGNCSFHYISKNNLSALVPLICKLYRDYASFINSTNSVSAVACVQASLCRLELLCVEYLFY